MGQAVEIFVLLDDSHVLVLQVRRSGQNRQTGIIERSDARPDVTRLNIR